MKDGSFTADRLLALYDRVAEAEDAMRHHLTEILRALPKTETRFPELFES